MITCFENNIDQWFSMLINTTKNDQFNATHAVKKKIHTYIYIIHTWSIMFNCIEAIILHYGQENKKHKHLLILEGNQKRKRKKS